ncbi:hypothetical protein [Bacteroides graminisolvens]|uniref:hypothetical protein n=1 Tax=Bacteroides graminisolvens TaxID=477666 RepID=UPI000402E5BF|nr:hypothetical protein [Bacteroides graminisolvens]
MQVHITPRGKAREQTPKNKGSAIKMQPNTPIVHQKSQRQDNKENNHARQHKKQTHNPRPESTRANTHSHDYRQKTKHYRQVTPVKRIVLRTKIARNPQSRRRNKHTKQRKIDQHDKTNQSNLSRKITEETDSNGTNTETDMKKTAENHKLNTNQQFTTKRADKYRLTPDREQTPNKPEN